MTTEYLNVVEESDGDVILEGSELYQALINVGYTDFDAISRVETKPSSLETDLSISNNYEFVNNFLNDKVNSIQQYLFHNTEFKKQIFKIILEGNILLDDHAVIVNDLLQVQKISLKRKVIGWLPFITSIIAVPFYNLFVKKANTITKTISFTPLLFLFYKKLKHWNTLNNLKHFITLQNNLHSLLKQCLKILRRNQDKKLVCNELYEKEKLIGAEKYNVILLIKQLIIEIFENLSNCYYEKASQILNNLPNTLHFDNLTKLEIKNDQVGNEKNYKDLKSLYYSFILVQSEMILIIAQAYNGRIKNIIYQIPNTKLTQIINDLIKKLSIYYSKISKLIQSYESFDLQPVKRVFRGVPSSKWQDVYIHLDLTSQRIQLAYKQIVTILDFIDANDETDHNNSDLVESIINKVNEAYKQIENARSFAEFSSLLIAKVQYKPINNIAKENENENLFPIDTKKNIIANKDPVIEDEVFEEYIKEEYLKPLYENDNGSTVQNFKLDKLLAKNFMTELKDALIEKQKSMTQRELKALKRMYDRILNNSCINKTEAENLSEKTLDNSTTSLVSVTPVPPLPPLPPLPPQSLIATDRIEIPIAPLPPPLLLSDSPSHIPSLLSPAPISSNRIVAPIVPIPPPLSSPTPIARDRIVPSVVPVPPPLPSPVSISKDRIIAENDDVNSERQLINGRKPVPLPRVKTLQPEDIMTDVERFSIKQCIPKLQFSSFQLKEETFLGSGENSDEENLDISNNSNDNSMEN